jgi:hypothetical protein
MSKNQSPLDVTDVRDAKRDGIFDHEKYRAWEREYIKSLGTYVNTGRPRIHGMCDHATEAARAAFPELIRCRGYVAFGRGPHWWCVAPDGTIIDPTRTQWDPMPTAADYVFLDESTADRLPRKCWGCGDDAFGQHPVCSMDCARGVADDMGISVPAGIVIARRPNPPAIYIENPGLRLPSP